MASVNYGSDPNGLICGFLFGPNTPGRPISLDEADAWLREAPAEGAFVWLHFNLSDA
ncbi:MAG: magnesium transporter CorA, partial [Rhizobacter sp.]|nr:magnesium transporter CorA [Rhizobacter sp.]